MSDLRVMSRQFITDFIELYRRNPCLWQSKSKEYMDRNKKKEAYKKLTAMLKTVAPDATQTQVINKINTLRGGFRREYKRVLASKQLGELYVPSLWYYELLLFVEDQGTRTHRKSVTNIQSDDDDDDEDHFQIKIERVNVESNNEKYDSSDTCSTIDDDDNTTQDSAPPNTRASASALITPDNRDKKQKMVHKNEKLQNSDDEFSIVGKNVAAKLRRLPRETKIYAEKLINDVLFKAELDQVNEHTRITSEIIRPEHVL